MEGATIGNLLYAQNWSLNIPIGNMDMWLNTSIKVCLQGILLTSITTSMMDVDIPCKALPSIVMFIGTLHYFRPSIINAKG